MHTYAAIAFQRTKVLWGSISEFLLGHSDKDKNKLIKTLMLFVIDTDFDSGRNLDGWLNASLFELDLL